MIGLEEKLILDGAIEKLINYSMLNKSERKQGKSKVVTYSTSLTKSQLESILRIIPNLKDYFKTVITEIY